jgi:outer membrane receptor protein involved in Fe transport
LNGRDLDLEPNYGTYACQLGLQCLFETKLDGGLAYRAYRGLELYGRLYNLLDKRYEEALGYPALPLNFTAGMRFRFPAE